MRAGRELINDKQLPNIAIKSININPVLLPTLLIIKLVSIEPIAYPIKRIQLKTPSTIS